MEQSPIMELFYLLVLPRIALTDNPGLPHLCVKVKQQIVGG